MNTPPKVADLEFTVDSDEEIFGLNIAVDYMFGVEVDEGIGHLVNVDSAAAFRKTAILHELLVHLALASELEHEEDAILVMEVTKEAKDVGVSKVLLDFDFASDLFLNSRLYDLLLVEALEGEDIMGFGLCPNHVNVPKPPLSQGTTDVKVIQVPVTSRPFPVDGM